MPEVVPDSIQWRKSSRSAGNGGQCVEVANLPTAVAVRDSKNPDGPNLIVTAPAWSTFLTTLKTGHLDHA